MHYNGWLSKWLCVQHRTSHGSFTLVLTSHDHRSKFGQKSSAALRNFSRQSVDTQTDRHYDSSVSPCPPPKNKNNNNIGPTVREGEKEKKGGGYKKEKKTEKESRQQATQPLTEGGDKGGFGDCGVLGPSTDDDVGEPLRPGGVDKSILGRCALGATIGTGLVTVTGLGFPNRSPSLLSPNKGSERKSDDVKVNILQPESEVTLRTTEGKLF